MTEPVGTFCLVLHSHLPWLAHHGRWPVGEEWLYQSWAHSYLPVVDVVGRLAAEGRRDLLTLGVTPVLAAQLDDPHCLRGMHDWLGGWLQRAHEAAPRLPDLALREHRAATAALSGFEARWRHGASPVLRDLAGSGVVELLGGPATHSFGPLLDDRVRAFALDAGLTDHSRRLGARPAGIWAPECGYAPGMETGYAAAGVERFVVDGPALHGDTALLRPVGESGVLVAGRDLDVTYRVWSPRAGYPGHADYRDFHTFDHPSGLKPSRVTGRHVAPQDKHPYDPDRAAVAVARDAADFVAVVRERLTSVRARLGRPGLTVAAFDTELFGHWWHEGPAWLEAVLRALPEAAVRVTTLAGAVGAGLVGSPVELPESSWGLGKDWHVWAGEAVSDLVTLGQTVQRDLRGVAHAGPTRDREKDALAEQALLALSSDWAFMVSHDSAADYARGRARGHAERVALLARLLAAGARDAAAAAVATWEPGPFGHIDARRLPRAGSRDTVVVTGDGHDGSLRQAAPAAASAPGR
ncbi:1,4-alpha-glucan-branching protein [Pseudonocardia sulfidoxydans NBRC 16205]|uniref:1,4-alpha-glucan-branching protein n=1 Tax=Pseudonocardia sulfidoxydans NBRC 16205 TaxID=1223511 RepID=A0A511DMU5_9PSEU|nr:1,4-alpha-glucan branching protein domain-containing protein [Pseudonocardia sulfidoxydans]GEL25114.1 1,4-alpha-glucan-branching protein [Pseudonocardia sulfidoxydans NBRC 16205]